MSKKNCRMTDAERAVHDRAVSLRKMTDQALCDYMDSQRKEGIDAGIALERASYAPCAALDEREVASRFVEYLAGKVGSGNGIGGGTILRLQREIDRAVGDGILRRVKA